jgi:AraC-like DNA-binding protein
MALVLDTGLLASQDAVEAVRAAFSSTEVPMAVEVDTSGAGVRHRLDSWDLGIHSHLQRFLGSGLRVSRRPKHLRAAAPDRLALSIQLRSSACLAVGGEVARTLQPGQLFIVDQTQCHDFRWSGLAGAKAFVIDYDRLDVPVEVARKAAPRLGQSQVYGLVRRHLARLCEAGPELSPGPARAMLGAATTDLLRALIATAAQDDSRQRGALHDTLLLRIEKYIEHHLTDQGLDAGQIAAAHNISVRQLYTVWSVNDVPLSQWIIAARLEGARRDLARPASGPGTVAATAHRWGFRDSTHFSRRFRAAYGMSPCEYQQQSRPAPPGPV